MSVLLNSYIIGPPPSWNLGIRITASNQTFGIQLNGTSPNITVDWGDGTVETFTTTGNKIRTYASAGNYTVKIRGSFGANGNIRLNNGAHRVISTSVIPTINGLTNFDSCFVDCSSLTSIPSGLFASNTAVTSFAGCFLSCSSLTSIPSGLFASNTAVTDFSDCFSNCYSLTSIPSGLFANNTAVTNFVACFISCYSLTSIPSGLFANNTAVIGFDSCFGGVTLTTTSYSNLLINMASNSASRQANVSFGGGNSKYNIDGQTAKNTLINTRDWSFTDGNIEV